MKSGKSPTYLFGRGIVFHFYYQIYYQKIEKWNGKLPKVTGGNAIVSLDDNSDTTNNETAKSK